MTKKEKNLLQNKFQVLLTNKPNPDVMIANMLMIIAMVMVDQVKVNKPKKKPKKELNETKDHRTWISLRGARYTFK